MLGLFLFISAASFAFGITNQIIDNGEHLTPRDLSALPNIVEPEFVPYVEEFEALYGKKIDKFPILFGDAKLTKTTVGFCRFIVGRMPPYIIIDKDYWQLMSDTTRKLLIFHELGHCVLDKDHVLWYLDNGCPASIMSVGIGTHLVDCYLKDRNYYEKELFSPKP